MASVQPLQPTSGQQDTFKSRYTSVHIILFIHVIMEVTTTTRGKPKLLWAGYAYTKHTEKNGMIRWRCTCRASKHCPASVYTNLLPANAVLKTDHNHCPEPVKLEVARCRTEMRVRAAACNDPPSRIYADCLAAADKWFMDGNFAMAPPKFLQLYVIHVSLGEVTIPLVYAFLENKTEATYHELFTAILNRCATYGVQPDPDVVMVDFELAVPRAVAGVFGQNVQVQFCFYHLTQSTWRKIHSVACSMALRFCHQLTCLLAWHTCVRLHQPWQHLWSTTSTKRTFTATTGKVGCRWEASGWCASLPSILCRRGMCTMRP